MAPSVFHEGELLLQQQAGSRARMAELGSRVIRDHMPQQHREFFGQLPFLVAGGLDAQAQPWASVLVGAPGFATSPDPKQLVVRTRPLAHDPLAGTWVTGATIGLLGIEPHTRRRNRLNGRIVESNEEGFVIGVSQSFGNCPKYIQGRKPEFIDIVPGNSTSHRMDALDDTARAIIVRADTFFIATAHPSAVTGQERAFGVDVSHRGGKPGFVHVDTNACLTVPDFVGNSYFNTLGNLALNPHCGLLFIDFERGDLLYVAARARIVADGPQVQAFRGAQRLLHIQPLSGLRVERSLPLRWSAAQLSPELVGTGGWEY